MLLLAALLAVCWANSPWAASYFSFWHTPLGFERSLAWLVDDVLMVVFFFVVGMEIRRELEVGELAEWRKAALPAFAALGGMLVPALLYLTFAHSPATRRGWGVPMATDIAFAVGVLALLGRRVPPALRVLRLALAVIDDLGAIVVIALFYSSGVTVVGALVALLGLASLLVLQRLGVRAKLAYVAPALVVWAGIHAAGIHPTIAGVVVGLMTPAAPRDSAASPAASLIELLEPWVAFGIMPLFALSNAGVSLSSVTLAGPASSVVSGVVVGLLLGKPLGILLAIGLTLRLGIGRLPAGIGVRQLIVLGVVAGVGFTMSLFISQLAFTEPGLLSAAKLAVLVASAGAASLGLLAGRLLLPRA